MEGHISLNDAPLKIKLACINKNYVMCLNFSWKLSCKNKLKILCLNVNIFTNIPVPVYNSN